MTTQHPFEPIGEVDDPTAALHTFIGRFTNQHAMHAYIIRHNLRGLRFTIKGKEFSQAFLDYPASAWDVPHAPRRKVPRP